MKPAGETTLTQEQLALAWRHMRRPHWPATLEQALRHPVYGPGLRGLARNLSRTAWNASSGPTHSLPCAHVPKTPAFPPAPPPRQRAATKRRAPMPADLFDARKAAANDFD